MKLACSFCGLEESKYRKLVAGPSVFICSECIRVAKDALDESEMDGKVFCSVCRSVQSPDECVVFEQEGYLCSACARELVKLVGEKIE